MMKTCCVLMVLMLSGVAAFAQGTIKGKVLDQETNEGLMFANVQLIPGNGTTTNEKGEFTIENLEFGRYEVMVSHICYEKFIVGTVLLSAEKPVADLGNVAVTPKSTTLPEFVFVSHSAPFEFGEGSTNNIINKMDILQAQPVGTEELLKTVAGVNVAGDMGISNRLNVGIRGSYPRRSDKVLILEDGNPIAPAPYLAPSAYYNPPTERLDGIEVHKGADILTYGPNSMYGAINYITRRPPLKPGLSAHLTGGQRGYHSQYITYGGTWNNIGAELQILNKHFDGFQDNTGTDIFNMTSKVYGNFGEKSTAFIKLNYHQEKSKATYSGQTPLTFALDPSQNPFDADDLTTRRYAVDLGHNFQAGKNLLLISRAYAHQFSRDWWRQNTTLINAADASTYLGETIFDERYSYLAGKTFGDDDWVRVGKITNGREGTKARNRVFRVAGLREALRFNYGTGAANHQLEVGATMQVEQFLNQEIKSDSSRFARSGTLSKDEKYLLEATSAYIKHQTEWGKFTITPMARFEYIRMRKFNLLSIATDPLNDGSKNFGAKTNTFSTFLPGVMMNYTLTDTGKNQLELLASAYQGYTPPTTSSGFIGVDEEGNVDTSPEDEDINMQAETSNSAEFGLRGSLCDQVLQMQVVGFYNQISNFYSAGRKEAFETLGGVDISGVEFGANLNLARWFKMQEHNSLDLNVNYTWLNSKIMSGKLADSDLFKAKHTDATKQELIDKINTERGGYTVYFAGATGDSLITRELTVDDFDAIETLEFEFGEGMIASNRAPYTPNHVISVGLNYGINGFRIGASIHYVGEQFTDYLNFTNETAEGAIGKLDAYQTIDFNMSYTFKSEKSKFVDGMMLFVSGKNLADNVYVASRLHRVSSGIMPGGFRQVNGGLRFSF